MSQPILVVDDEAKIARLVRDYLEQAGYPVTLAFDGREALAAFRHEKPRLVILDLMLPEVDGLDVARIIRKESDTPIIMLTARVEEVDRLIGLELGADDYVTKPFSPRELVARVRAVLRRTEGHERAAPLLSVGDLAIDPERRTVTVAGRAVELTPTEFDLLTVLARHPGRVFSRMELLERVQGYAYEGYERTVDAHIKNIRQKIEEHPRKPRYILTIYGLGYKFSEVERA
ncbi:MAG: response regulator transcription factor [Anaerolineae bacterium]|jgi:DNA-binding response OmpR family regulator|nr:MAG: response regulator transcription factor [Anaerolineae bacterium]